MEYVVDAAYASRCDVEFHSHRYTVVSAQLHHRYTVAFHAIVTSACRCDVEFQKLALRGVSLLFGSGDNGVTGDKGACHLGKFVPWWPASSPYVTAVGATNAFMPTGATFSGGGFSDRHAAPSFQRPLIAAYMKAASKLPPAKWFNHSGRGFPDVSAVGLSFWVYNGGLPTEVRAAGGRAASYRLTQI